MISIALIGADGAGKTTIADRLCSTFPKPMKYIYMGINIESSNVALPTSRLIEFAKKVKHRKKNGGEKQPVSLHNRQTTGKKGWLLSVWYLFRLFNRLGEEWYRQLLSWIYRKRGYIVLYDRHFLFDFDEGTFHANKQDLPLAERIHRWCLHMFYPEPDLVLFLDAPAEVLFARKGEANLEYLRDRRTAYKAQGAKTQNFCTVDATQPVDEVYATVTRNIEELYAKRRNGKS